MICLYLFFFFFQAEDGIRDLTVTGVQTCALPISAMIAKTTASSINVKPLDFISNSPFRMNFPKTLLNSENNIVASSDETFCYLIKPGLELTIWSSRDNEYCCTLSGSERKRGMLHLHSLWSQELHVDE